MFHRTGHSFLQIRNPSFYLRRKLGYRQFETRHQQNESFAIQIKLLPALAFAPPCDILNLFAGVVQDLPMPMAEGLVLYFGRTYVGRILPGGTFQQPLFPVEMWDSHFEVLTGYKFNRGLASFV